MQIISDYMLKIDSYSFERKDRKGKNGGGLIVYLSNNVIYKRRHDLEINEIESLWLEVSIGKSKPVLLNLTQNKSGWNYTMLS